LLVKKCSFPSLPLPPSILDEEECTIPKNLRRKEFKAFSGCFEKPLVLGEFAGCKKVQEEQGVTLGESFIELFPQETF